MIYSKSNKRVIALLLYCSSSFLIFGISNIESEQESVQVEQEENQPVWTRTSDEGLKLIFNDLVYKQDTTTIGIRAHDIFVPKTQLSNKKPIVIVLVHGTWAQEVKAYFNPEKKFYTSIREFARSYAEKHQVPTEIISFRWSGNNYYKDRHEAACALAALLNNHFPDATLKIVAHSHGCSVVHEASSQLKDDLIIDHIINIAAPVRETVDNEYKPTHFKRLTQFYSTSDLVVMAGSVKFDKFAVSAGNIHRFMPQENRTVVNVRTQINGNDTGHSSIKLIARYLGLILDKIEEKYRYNTDFDLDVCLQNSDELKDLSKAAQDPVLLSIRRHPTLATIVARELKNSDQTIKELSAAEFLRIFQQEIAYSNSQELAYLERYGKDMHIKQNLFYRMKHGFNLEMAKMGPLLPMSSTWALTGLGLGALMLAYFKLTAHPTIATVT